MGAQLGGGWADTGASFETLVNNIHRLSKRFPLNSEGRFGNVQSIRAAEIITDDPMKTAQLFWNALRRGGWETTHHSKYGIFTMASFSDGSRVVWRPTTRSSVQSGTDNPAVELRIVTMDGRFPHHQRIHFRRK